MTTDKNELEKIVDNFENADIIKPQDLRAWYRSILLNQNGQQLAWDWLRQDWSWLEKTIGGDMEFTSYITVTAKVFDTAQRLTEFKEFFEPKIDQPGLGREIKMDTRVIATKAALVANEKAQVNEAIKAILSQDK